MQLVDKRDVQFPNICSLCETAPYDDDQLIDTGYMNLRNPVDPLYGRKYICPRCASEIAKYTGYVPLEEAVSEANSRAYKMQKEFEENYRIALQALHQLLSEVPKTELKVGSSRA